MSGNLGRFVCHEHHQAFANKGRFVQHLGEVEHHDPNLRGPKPHEPVPTRPHALAPAAPAPGEEGATVPKAASGIRILGHKRREKPS